MAAAHDVSVFVKREDCLHPYFGGNKYYKLWQHVQNFKAQKASCLLSFGGAHSNHILALAALGDHLGFNTLGVIRGGAELGLNPTLIDAKNFGMHLHFVGRGEYRNKNSEEFLEKLNKEYPNCYVIPEGGDDLTGSIGCSLWAQSIFKTLSIKLDAVCLACATGGTSAGFLSAIDEGRVEAVLVLKGRDCELATLRDKIIERAQLIKGGPIDAQKLALHTDAHMGGYAKFPAELADFITDFERETSILLDPVYTGKLFWNIAKKIKAGYWAEGSKILAIHSGGLQGRRGFGLSFEPNL